MWVVDLTGVVIALVASWWACGARWTTGSGGSAAALPHFPVRERRVLSVDQAGIDEWSSRDGHIPGQDEAGSPSHLPHFPVSSTR